MKVHIPYFDFYPSDFMNGVRGLTAQDVGVYTMILCRIYEESGPVEMHTRRLATYCGMREATFKKVLEKLIDLDKFQVVDGMIFNRRAETEISNRAHKLKIKSKAGKASAEKRQQKQDPTPTGVQQPFNHTDTDTDTDTKEEEEARAKARCENSFEDFFGELLSACGLTDDDSLPVWWSADSAKTHVLGWKENLGLSEDRIIDIARTFNAEKPELPDGPKALDRAMKRAADADGRASKPPRKKAASEEDVAKYYADWINSDRLIHESVVSSRVKESVLSKGLVTVERMVERGLISPSEIKPQTAQARN